MTNRRMSESTVKRTLTPEQHQELATKIWDAYDEEVNSIYDSNLDSIEESNQINRANKDRDDALAKIDKRLKS